MLSRIVVLGAAAAAFAPGLSGVAPRALRRATLEEGAEGAAEAKSRAEAAIAEALVTPEGNSCPLAVRLAWHSSGTFDASDGTGGSDGATMRFDPEKSDGANAGLDIEHRILAPAAAKVPEVSLADVWILAGARAVSLTGGPEIDCRLGRKDAADGSACPPTGRLPEADQGADHLRHVFYRMGFGDREIVALSGAHTLGRCHPERSGFEGPWTTKPLQWDNEYFRNLLEKEWVPRDWDGKAQFTDAETKTLTMLPSDLVLIEDPEFKKYVEAYAADQDLFFQDFKAAYETLLSLGCPEPCAPR